MAGDLAVWLLILSILSRKKRAAQSCCSWDQDMSGRRTRLSRGCCGKANFMAFGLWPGSLSLAKGGKANNRSVTGGSAMAISGTYNITAINPLTNIQQSPFVASPADSSASTPSVPHKGVACPRGLGVAHCKLNSWCF